MKHYCYKSAFISLLVILVAASGCDQISKFTERFKAKNSPKQTAPAPVAENPAGTPAAVPQANQQNPSAEKTNPTANILARVGGWTMTLEQFNDRLKALKEIAPDYNIKDPEQKKQVLDELVRQQLLVQDAMRTGADKKKEIVEAVDEFRRTLLVREVATKIVENVTATEQEATDYYNTNKADFTEPTQWRLREIVVDTEADANAILVELYKGADFIEMVKQKSKGKTAWQKGDTGFISTFDSPKLESVVQALEVGQVSNVFKGPEGFYIVKLEEKKGGAQKNFEDVKKDIITGLTLLKQQQTLLSYLDELRKKTAVEINANLLTEEKGK